MTRRTVHALVEAVDVVPTLLEYAGIPIPPCVQGRSLLRLIGGETESHRTSALTEMAGWKTLRTDRFRYVARANGEEHLFDLESDPAAYHDVAREPNYAAALNEARHELIRRMLAMEQPLPRTWPY